MSFFCKKLKAIEVNRDGNDVRAVMDSLKCLKNGEKISLFPEGTRNKTDAEMLPFKSGAAVMAIKAKVPVVPMMIYKKPKPFRLNHILMGEPFEFTEYYGRKMTDDLVKEADREALEQAARPAAQTRGISGGEKRRKKS